MSTPEPTPLFAGAPPPAPRPSGRHQNPTAAAEGNTPSVHLAVHRARVSNNDPSIHTSHLGSAPLGGDLAGHFGNDVSEHGERLLALFGRSVSPKDPEAAHQVERHPLTPRAGTTR